MYRWHVQLFTAYENIFALAKKKNRNVKCILGGPAASAHPEFILNELEPDFLVLGEGEETTAELLRCINDNDAVENVRGIAYVDNVNDQIFRTEARPPIKNIDSLPFPDREGFGFPYFLEHYHKYSTLSVRYKRENVRTAFVIGGRDCPGKCTFCFRVMGGRLRLRSIDDIISEIKSLKDIYGINEIEMLDDVFAIKKKRVYEFCRKVEPLGIHWWCQMIVRHVDEEILKEMKRTGCDWVGYGFESASDTVLKSMKKGIRASHIEKALYATRKAKISLQANFIFGDPAETLETADETLRFWRKHKSFHINLSFIIPFPGTKLYNDLVARGQIKNLRFFWDNYCVDEDGKTKNLTSLSANEERLMRARVFLEKSNPSSFMVKYADKTAEGAILLDIICPVCKGEYREKFLTRPQIVACPGCFQRSSINVYNLPDRNKKVKKIGKHIQFIVLCIGRNLFRNRNVGLILIQLFRVSNEHLNYYSLLNRFGIDLLKKSKTINNIHKRRLA